MAEPKKKRVVLIESDPQSCGSCKFFLKNADNDYGYCRRYPPLHVYDGETGGYACPVAVTTDWCGEYARRTH